MRVITNAKSTAATHHDPAYRSFLANHTRRQIELLQKNITPESAAVTAAADHTAVSINPPCTLPVDKLDESIFTPLGFASCDDTRDLSLPIFAPAKSGSAAGPTLADQPNISPISFGSTDSDLCSPVHANIWQLDPVHVDLSEKMSGHQPSYGWQNLPEPGQSERATYGNTALPADRLNDVGGARPFSYSGPSSLPPPLAISKFFSSNIEHCSFIDPGYQNLSYYVQHSATAPRNYDHAGIDPARLNGQNLPRNYDQVRALIVKLTSKGHAKMSPLRSPTESPMASHSFTPSYADLNRAGPSGSMSAREPTFNNPFTGNPYTNGRFRRHSDEDPALGPHSRIGGSGSNGAFGKRKATWSGTDTDLATIKQELDFLAQTEREVAELKNDLPSGDRKERRRMQNRLAQRAFRARSKVHHQEVSSRSSSLRGSHSRCVLMYRCPSTLPT